VGGLGALGAAPGPNGGLLLEVGARWSHLSLSLGGRADLSSGMKYDGGTVSTALLIGELLPCAHYGWFGGCLVVAGGAETAQATLLPGSQSNIGPFFALGLRALVDLPVTRWFAIRGAVEALAPVTRDNVKVGPAVAFTVPVLSGDLSLSAVFTLF
jgi:hypothetical protein